MTRPAASVSATEGWTLPRFVVNVICVPECGGVPAASITCAMISAEPLMGSAVALDVSVIVDPVGASSGTRSHAIARTTPATGRLARMIARRRATMKAVSILIPMKLAGQATERRNGERGYAMAALLVAMSIMEGRMAGAMLGWDDKARRAAQK